MTHQERAAFATAAIAGVGMWVGIALAAGEIEAWDSNYYFVVGLPFLALVSFTLGAVVPQMPWRWAVTIGVAQVAAMFLLHPGLGPLLAVGLALHAAVIVGLAVTAFVGAGVGQLLRHWRAG